MAFTIEAVLTVPLSLTMVFSGVARLPKLEAKLYRQSVSSAKAIKTSIDDDFVYKLSEVGDGYALEACLTSPRKMQEAISYSIDLSKFVQRHRGRP